MDVGMDIGTLIVRSTDGDWQAFADLVKQHQSLAFGYAFAMLGDFHLAEDATQEAFVAVYFQVHTLRSPDAFTWRRSPIPCGDARRSWRASATICR